MLILFFTFQYKVLYTNLMFRRILAIGFIFLCTVVAWGVLSATIFSRTEGSGSGLREKVAGSWGSEQEATPPIAEYYRTETHKVTKKLDDKDIQELVQERVPMGCRWNPTI